ncbi:TPA: protein ren [Citrobacter murliniae]
MTGRETITEYLKTHKTFCFAEVAAATGQSLASISQAANKMFRAGELVVDKKVWRTVWYRLPDDAERTGKVSTNLIFQECRENWQGYRIHKIFGSHRQGDL